MRKKKKEKDLNLLKALSPTKKATYVINIIHRQLQEARCIGHFLHLLDNLAVMLDEPPELIFNIFTKCFIKDAPKPKRRERK